MLNRTTTPFKPNASVAALPALPFGVLEIAGPDAVAFAQAQFTNDAAALADGHWQWSGWLTPKGRVIALFALLKLDPERVWLLLPDAPAATLATRLARYVFRSKLRLDVRDGLRILADIDGAVLPAPPSPAAILRIAGMTVLDLSDAHAPRRLALVEDAAADAGGAAPIAAQWRRSDLAAGLPRLVGDQVEAWTPQMLGLDSLRAYSLKKGCYPGQEIVSRTHYLGQAKRGPVLLSGGGFADGDAVRMGDRDVGIVVAAADDLALAVIALEHRTAALSCNGSPCTVQPFREGLAR
ncbi:YgfZ/GcvT domain-containing protein [Coralloluteibacterium stylophorae]|uniref:Folate-binding protein YgfZ n=2 Tax=Coralloluteibacterium stylophorae TaxID=1776034 RepID=A0AAP2C8T1_9GAMM|nr:folate-binding protein [Coralloluteibacterium stylophorae]MBS7455829.1 folate-binding protein YgfZ [Coralloluteibacterium stylophorae]